RPSCTVRASGSGTRPRTVGTPRRPCSSSSSRELRRRGKSEPSREGTSMPQAKKPASSGSSSSRSTKRKAASTGGARKTSASRRSGTASSGRRSSPSPSQEPVREQLQRLIDPRAVVVLTRERLQEALDEAVQRGRMTRDDAGDLLADL